MAFNEVQVANSALLKLGALPIMSLNDDSKEARTCKLRIQLDKEIVLRMHPWNCATKRTIMAPLAAEPEFGYQYQFQLPADYLRPVEVSTDDYRIEGRVLLCNDAEVEMRYVFDQQYDLLDPMLAECIATHLAVNICYPLTQSLGLKNQMEEDFKLDLRKAKTVDAQDEPAQIVEADTYIAARTMGNGAVPMRNWPAEGYPMP
jgi:hypothetical protein